MTENMEKLNEILSKENEESAFGDADDAELDRASGGLCISVPTKPGHERNWDS